jgi:hypothetical protein
MGSYKILDEEKKQEVFNELFTKEGCMAFKNPDGSMYSFVISIKKY